MKIFEDVTGFDWDKGSLAKTWEKHGVNPFECEEVFFNEPLVVEYDEAHSALEKRYYALGRTNSVRLLFVVFTIRGDRIRVISARDMNRKERGHYQ